jgi:HAD superfamily hydrolase (TIGR01509 family)
MKLSGAIFDLDGTLLDSMKIWDNLGHDYLISLGISPKMDLKEKLASLSLIQAAEYFNVEYHVNLSVPEIMAGINHLLEQFYCHTAPAKKNVPELIQRFHKAGVNMCVATATDKTLAKAALKRIGLLDYFKGILTCTEVGLGKDNPEIYKKALELLGTNKKETYVFEDALHAIQTAKKAGFFVVGVHDESAKTWVEEIKKISDIYIDTFKEMERYI